VPLISNLLRKPDIWYAFCPHPYGVLMISLPPSLHSPHQHHSVWSSNIWLFGSWGQFKKKLTFFYFGLLERCLRMSRDKGIFEYNYFDIYLRDLVFLISRAVWQGWEREKKWIFLQIKFFFLSFLGIILKLMTRQRLKTLFIFNYDIRISEKLKHILLSAL